MISRNKPTLTEPDVTSIRDFLRSVNIEKSLNTLIQEWLYFVEEVKRGYPFSIYDYTNDLTVRDVLQEVGEEVSPEGQMAIAGVLQPIDEDFRLATKEIDKPLMPSMVSRGNWWWYRIPIAGSGTLESELDS